MPNIAWFFIKIKDADYEVTIRGDIVGPAYLDGSRRVAIEVEANGLVVKTEKTFDPDLAGTFVQQIKVMQATGVPQAAELKSQMYEDFVLSFVPQADGCHIDLRLRHGYTSQWSIAFEFDVLISAVEVEAGL
jgi:hypothetical protein